MHGEMVYVAETARDTVLVFRKYPHSYLFSDLPTHSLPLSLLPLAPPSPPPPGAAMLYALCWFACMSLCRYMLHALLLAPRLSSACSCLVPYASCLQLLSSRRFSLQCKMKVMYRCMQE